MNNRPRLMIYTNAIVVILVLVYFFALPAVTLIQALNDPGLRSGEIPGFVFRWHRSLSEDMEQWALDRVSSGRASELDTSDISGTEWPVFSSVFYLWTTEALQEAWEEDPSLADSAPAVYARGAIEAVTALVADPNHAAWVVQHWGEDYLDHENLFYRMLLISGLTSYQTLLGEDTYETTLRQQVESLADEIDASPYGLLDDYPGECYPVDILPAIAAIQRADEVLGTDHSAFVIRSLRAFEDTRLDPATGLPAYRCDSFTGEGLGSARGVGISYMLIWAPELWPETAQEWYHLYEEQFWQESWLAVGFREFPIQYPYTVSPMGDVDSGPIPFGFGTAASAFGIGAARANGDFERAYPLSAEALVLAWPLPDGTLLMPRLLSNLTDAPFTGEAALLFTLTRGSAADNTQGRPSLPFSVYLGLCIYAGIAVGGVILSIKRVGQWEKGRHNSVAAWQFITWLLLMAFGLGGLLLSCDILGGILFLAAQFFPRMDRNP
ncbi:MAG TPA: hypothetical protein VN376_03365 [Longilinea sp.]|nr:hypothetical protein [Longilinea sp.]